MPFKPQTIQDKVWRYLRNKKSGTLDAIMMAIQDPNQQPISRKTVNNYIARLVNNGCVTKKDEKYILINDTGPLTPKTDHKTFGVIDANIRAVIKHEQTQKPISERQKVWTIIRQIKQFTVNDVISRIPGKSSRNNIVRYLRHLTRAGFLEKQGDSWVVLKDNGPYSPYFSLKKQKGIDPNLDSDESNSPSLIPWEYMILTNPGIEDINKAGKECWELVGVNPGEYVFKRPRGSNE